MAPGRASTRTAVLSRFPFPATAGEPSRWSRPWQAFGSRSRCQPCWWSAHSFSKPGLFEETLDCYEDYDLWLRLAALAEAAIVREPLVKVRWHDRRYSRTEPLVDLRSRIQLFLERALRQVRDPAVRAELQRIRALDSARLANLVARSGDAGNVSYLLRGSLANGWTSPRWWLIAAQAHSRLWTVRTRLLRESP